jgi:hypothetical protein
MNDSKIFNWPGWTLANNPYGDDFDLPARKRMLAGSQMLYPILKKHRKAMGKVILEVGPFFDPLITPKEFPNAEIFFWENDSNVLKYLKNTYPGKNVYPIFCDLNKIEGKPLLKLKLETKKYFSKLNLKKISFDAVIISQVFNYIDYKLFLIVLKDFIKKDGLIFINNVVDYGLPTFFSKKRPKSILETTRTVIETGYDLLDKKIYESSNKKSQKNKRLILVAKNTGR